MSRKNEIKNKMKKKVKHKALKTGKKVGKSYLKYKAFSIAYNKTRKSISKRRNRKSDK